MSLRQGAPSEADRATAETDARPRGEAAWWRRRRTVSVGRIVAPTVFLAVAVAAAWFARRYAVDWVYADDLLTADWIARLQERSLSGWGLLSIWDNQHPVGAQTALIAMLFGLVGVHFEAVVFLSVAVIWATAVAAWRLARDATDDPAAEVALCLCVSLAAFHPNQMEHLLWAFELGWFLVNACVLVNAVLIETARRWTPLPVAMLCLVATFSSAQGAFAWFAAALHLGLRGGSRRGALASVALVVCGLLATARIAVRSAAIGPDQPSLLDSLAGLPVFALQIVGTTLGTRNHPALLVAGLAFLGLAGALALVLARRGGDRRRLRCACVLIAFSLLCVLGFARGRAIYGLDWALGSFHAAPLLVSASLGAVLLVGEGARQARRDRAAAILALSLAVFLAVGFGLSCPYGIKRARLWAMDRGYAAWAACEGKVPFEAALRAAGGEGFGDAFARALPLLSPMCGGDPDALDRALTREPALFRDLAAARPDARPALDAIWQDYATEMGLQVAFDPARPATPARLIALAKVEARRGAPFDHRRWEPFAAILLTLP